jgi:hypothetical protein
MEESLKTLKHDLKEERRKTTNLQDAVNGECISKLSRTMPYQFGGIE